MRRRLAYWLGGLALSVATFAEMVRLWWIHDDDEPPHGAVPAC